jgi:hypothetical protein
MAARRASMRECCTGSNDGAPARSSSTSFFSLSVSMSSNMDRKSSSSTESARRFISFAFPMVRSKVSLEDVRGGRDVR